MNFGARDDHAVREALRAAARGDGDALLRDLRASADGLSESEAAERLSRYGPNRIAHDAGAGGMCSIR